MLFLFSWVNQRNGEVKIIFNVGLQIPYTAVYTLILQGLKYFEIRNKSHAK